MRDTLPQAPSYYIERVRALHVAMRDHLLAHLHDQEERALGRDLASVADVRDGDTIYRIDEYGEETLLSFCTEWSREAPFVLISEGIEGAGWRPFPDGASAGDGQFLLIVDPIDGTRNIMYNKRSAWILSGIAPNLGPATSLLDIEAAVMTEVPTTRHLYSDQLWAHAGGGAHREAQNLINGEKRALPLCPSQAPNLAHGFASIAKFFPAAKAATARLEEELLARVLPDDTENPLVFDDQYISTGGQLYEMIVGHDRFLADLRPLFFEALGLPPRLACHPYDICTELIAREAGVIVTGSDGARLNAPLDIRAPVAWVAYANARLQETIEPHLLELLRGLKEDRH